MTKEIVTNNRASLTGIPEVKTIEKYFLTRHCTLVDFLPTAMWVSNSDRKSLCKHKS